jgi:hypothetical protein
LLESIFKIRFVRNLRIKPYLVKFRFVILPIYLKYHKIQFHNTRINLGICAGWKSVQMLCGQIICYKKQCCKEL